MPVWLTAIIEAVTAIFKFGEKVAPPDEIKISNHEIKKPRLEQKEKVSIYDAAYRRLKDHTEIDIWQDIQFNYDNLSEQDQKELFELLTDRIRQYRLNHKIRFKKWLKQENLIK